MGSMAQTGLLLVPSDALGHTWALPGVLGAGQGLPPESGLGNLKLSLADQLAILATAVHDRQHLVQPGASAEDAVTALVAEDLLYDAGRPAPSVAGGPASSGDQPPPPKLLEKALMMPNFQALAASLEGADAQSDEG